jgi:hypothetical protein
MSYVTNTDPLFSEVRADDEGTILVIVAVFSVTYELSLQEEISF